MRQAHTENNYSEVNNKSKSSQKILVTAGSTIEPLDPVRFLSNHSTGRMGYEIAAEGAKRGYDICLVSGPVHIPPPPGVETIDVTTAFDMQTKVMERIDGCDCVIMAAAVCDFRPEKKEKNKIKKRDEIPLKLVKNPDILSGIAGKAGIVKVGFALETENPIENGKNKLEAKGLDMIIVNVVSDTSDPFGVSDEGVSYIVIEKDGTITTLERKSKEEIAGIIIEKTDKLMA